MHRDVVFLLEIQELDVEILELQRQLGLYPGIWDEIRDDVKSKRAVADTARASNENHTAERRRVEADIRSSMDRLKKYQTQMEQITNNKEFMALSTQVEHLRQRISALEEEGLALLERDETVAAERVAAEKALAAAETLARTEKERIRAQVNEKKDRLDRLRKDRESLVSKVDPQALVLYERINKRWPGRAVVPVRGGSCTGCNYRLLASSLVDLHLDEKINTCQNCSRILSMDESRQEAEVVS